MKRKIAALTLCLLLLCAILPSASLADYSILASVGGKTFTSIGQTIHVGGGTATLTLTHTDDLLLVLKDVHLTDYRLYNTAEDGTAYYAAIFLYSPRATAIEIEGSCRITAPKHDDSRVYEGIFARTGSVSVIGGSLTVEGCDYGASCISPEPAYASSMTFENKSLTMDCLGGSCLYAPDVIHLYSPAWLSCRGFCGIETNSLLVTKPLRLTVTPDTSRRCKDAYGIYAKHQLFLQSTAEVTLDYDAGSYRGTQPIKTYGIYTEYLTTYSGLSGVSAKSTLRLHGTALCSGIALHASQSNIETICGICELTGAHDTARAVRCYVTSGVNIEAGIYGAHEGDIAFLGSSQWMEGDLESVYAYTDHESAPAYYVVNNLPQPITNEPLQGMNIHYPRDGYMEIYRDDVNEIYSAMLLKPDGSIATAFFADTGELPFRDLNAPAVKTFLPAILWAVEEEITAGVTAAEFRPYQTCNREQAVTFLWRAAGRPEPKSTENPFSDVSEQSPFYKAILWGSENGIVSGYADGSFRPKNACTRAHVVSFLWRYMGQPTPEAENPFSDVSEQSPFLGAILWGSENGIVFGYGDGSFRPSDTCTRAHIVSFLYRALR